MSSKSNLRLIIPVYGEMVLQAWVRNGIHNFKEESHWISMVCIYCSAYLPGILASSICEVSLVFMCIYLS